MMGSRYVSDPDVWRKFYRNMLDGKFDPSRYRGQQTGSGIGGMYDKKPYMIPVNPHLEYKQKEKIVVGKEVTPVAAVVERAKSELKDTIKENVPHVPVEKNMRSKKRPLPISIKVATEEATPSRKSKKLSKNKKKEIPNIFSKKR